MVILPSLSLPSAPPGRKLLLIRRKGEPGMEVALVSRYRLFGLFPKQRIILTVPLPPYDPSVALLTQIAETGEACLRQYWRMINQEHREAYLRKEVVRSRRKRDARARNAYRTLNR